MFQRVNLSNTQAITYKASGSRTPSWTNPNTKLRLGGVNYILQKEEIARSPSLLDNLQFKNKPVSHIFWKYIPIYLFCFSKRKVFQIVIFIVLSIITESVRNINRGNNGSMVYVIELNLV